MRRRARAPRTPARTTRQDAVAVLKADHRQVEKLFRQFARTRSAERKADLAARICTALLVHTQIEEEVFYPAFIAATRDRDTHHEAVVEHAGARELIYQIRGSGPYDDYYDARVTVLAEMIRHHVNEEEQRGGMFAKAKRSKMDLADLGEQLRARRQELMAAAEMTEQMHRPAQARFTSIARVARN